MPAERVVSLSAYRLERAVGVRDPERLPLAMASYPGAVSLVLGDDVELWLSPSQADELAADLQRLARDARGRT